MNDKLQNWTQITWAYVSIWLNLMRHEEIYTSRTKNNKPFTTSVQNNQFYSTRSLVIKCRGRIVEISKSNKDLLQSKTRYFWCVLLSNAFFSSSSYFFVGFFVSNLFENFWEADSLEHLIRATFINWFSFIWCGSSCYFSSLSSIFILCAAYRFSGVPTNRIIINPKTTHQRQSNS